MTVQIMVTTSTKAMTARQVMAVRILFRRRFLRMRNKNFMRVGSYRVVPDPYLPRGLVLPRRVGEGNKFSRRGESHCRGRPAFRANLRDLIVDLQSRAYSYRPVNSEARPDAKCCNTPGGARTPNLRFRRRSELVAEKHRNPSLVVLYSEPLVPARCASTCEKTRAIPEIPRFARKTSLARTGGSIALLHGG